MAGWIKLHRKLLMKAFYSKDSEKVHLWIHILFKANHYGNEEMLGGKPFKCLPGQFTTGRKQLSIETGISESKIERILDFFEKIEHQIEQQKTNTNRLISILNWGEYQQSEQQNEQRPNNDRTHYKNIKKDIICLQTEFANSIKNAFQNPNDWEKIQLNKFYDYWSEPNKSKTKLKYQLQKTWDINLRLKTWFRNSEEWAKSHHKQ